MKQAAKESDIQACIRDYLRWSGWFCFKVHQSLGCFPGVADLYAIKNGLGVWVEVKRPGGRQSDDQKLFQAEVEKHGGIYILARSVDDVIEKLRELKGDVLSVSRK